MAKAKAKNKVAKKPQAKKVVAKKAAPKKVVAKKAVPKKAVAKKAVPKKVVAKKVLAKKSAPPAKVAKKSVVAKPIASKKSAVKTEQKNKAQVAAKVSKAAPVKEKITAKTKVAKPIVEKAAKEAKAPKAVKPAKPLKPVKEVALSKKKGKKSEDDDEDLPFGESTKKYASDEDEEDEFFEDVKPAKIPSQKRSLVELEEKIHVEIADLREHFSWNDIATAVGTLDFFVNQKSDECEEKGCDNLRTTQSYCRLHYIANWNDIKKKREILKEGRLQAYIEELVSKYPQKVIESIVDDLEDDKDFFHALNELNITSEMEFVEEEFDAPEEDDDADEDIAVETRTFGGSRFDED